MPRVPVHWCAYFFCFAHVALSSKGLPSGCASRDSSGRATRKPDYSLPFRLRWEFSLEVCLRLADLSPSPYWRRGSPSLFALCSSRSCGGPFFGGVQRNYCPSILFVNTRTSSSCQWACLRGALRETLAGGRRGSLTTVFPSVFVGNSPWKFVSVLLISLRPRTGVEAPLPFLLCAHRALVERFAFGVRFERL